MWAWLTGKKKKRTGESKVVEDFAKLLREHGETILAGKAKLSLTSQVLISLNRQFQQLQLTTVNGQDIFQVIIGDGLDKDLGFIFDFIQKAQNLKLVSGPFCHPSPQLCLLPFKSLKVLEIHRVPIVYVRGLHLIAKHINTLICCRSTSSIKDAVYEFGRDFNGVLTLLELETLDLSYNTITSLDQSLKLLPSLQNLNLCHNCLVNADSEYLPPVDYLNLGFNSINCIPKYSMIVSASLTILILRNNNLSSLEGVQLFNCLKTLDVSSNCLVCFDDLSPLAQLQYLVTLNLKGNPVEFMQKYRILTISRLSPVARGEPVILDGKMLDPLEILCLGKDVEPVPLRSYIPNKPLGRPSSSLINLANSVHELSKELPMRSSTPNRSNRKISLRKDGRKIREPTIFDPAMPPSSTTAIPETIMHNSGLGSLQAEGSFSSKKSSIDDSVIWVHKSNGDEVEVSRSLPGIDYASFDPGADRATNTLISLSTEEPRREEDIDDSIYSNMPADMTLSSSSSSSVGVVSEDDDLDDDTDSPTYLVESIICGVRNEIEEKESLFVILKNSYLVEKDPYTGQVVKLDLNYLREVVPCRNGTLKVTLRFDLLRSDRKKRMYLFEDIDNIHEFNQFVDRLEPVAAKNNELIKSKFETWECLKCLTVFDKISAETSFNLCPNCKSSMVVEKAGKSLSGSIDISSLTRQIEDGSSLDYSHMNGHSLGCSAHSHVSQLSMQVEGEANPLNRDTSSIEIITPFQTEADLQSSEKAVDQVDGDDTSRKSPFLKPDFNGEPNSSASGAQSLQNNTDSASSEQSNEGNNNHSKKNTSEVVDNINKIKTYIKAKLSGSLGSMTSSEDKGSVPCSEPSSRCTTPCTSHESKRSHSRPSRPNTVSPYLGSSSSLICINKDDLWRCDHRLKLYFSMELFQDIEEDFSCMLKCSCVRYDRDVMEECVLLVSTRNIYIVRLKEIDSNEPKNWMKLIVKYPFTEIRYIDYGYFNQSFRIECEREFGSYKFIVGDSERCQKFLAFLLHVLQDSLEGKEFFPIIMEDPNPRTLFNMRSQIFGMKEDLLSLAKRLYEQATNFTVPPLLKNKKMRIRTHQHCVTGKDLVDWLVSRKEAKSRASAVSLMQRLVDVGFLYHVSKELQFEDVEALYKFDVNDNHKKASFLRRNCSYESGHSDSSQNSLEDFDMNTDVCLYQIVSAKLASEDASLANRTICMTKTHLFLIDESHQWPLSRLHQSPAFLNQQFKIFRSQRIIDMVKIVFYEDSPCHLSIEFLDELCDSDSRETAWLIMVDTVREISKLVNSLKTIWEGELKVELPSEVLPFCLL